MRQLRSTAGSETRTTFVAYLVRRLIRAKFDDLKDQVVDAHEAYRATLAGADDEEWTVQWAVADRDLADEDLDLTTRTFFAALGGRSADAKKSSPYKDLAPKGVAQYTEADLDEQVPLYGLLADRIESVLPAADALRPTATTIRTQLETWKVEAQAVADARNAQQLTRDARDRAKAELDRTIASVYGALIQRVGKPAAERFFPRPEKKKEEAKPAEPAPAEPAAK